MILLKIRFWIGLKKAFLVVKSRFFKDKNFARRENSKIPVRIASLGQYIHFSLCPFAKISSELIFICKNVFLTEIHECQFSRSKKKRLKINKQKTSKIAITSKIPKVLRFAPKFFRLIDHTHKNFKKIIGATSTPQIFSNPHANF